ncbi:lytic polysaccharide monooxygenase [Nocardiopsis ganjiahuensis]|uniref:lytic polysaccharide monooxygenase n=1 Tax=Nocardiopsis ganjiahuensis TaxID=239984 RepID=UPI0003455BC6|nr:lytic polysaccharide monooxygenase [Nocardiopsis ganjiahuensis]
MRARNSIGLTLALGGLAVGTAVFALPDSAEAHGAFTYPASRTYACFDDATGGTGGGALAPTNAACADALAEGGDYAFWNWYGNLVPDSDGRHREYVPDGELCGAHPDFAAFNEPREDWPTTALTAGETVEFRHNAWAPHPGTFFTYVTTDGYDTDTPLNWDDLELIDEVTDPPLRSGGDAGAEYYWDVDLPDREGRHIVYVVWERSDSPEAFYNCSDVVFGEEPGGTDPDPDPSPDPDPTPSPDPSPDPTDPPEGEYCTAEYTVVSQWNDGFQAEVEVTAGEDGVSGWMVDWVFANRQEITSIWNASVVNHGAHFEASSTAHNGTLAAGESTSFGFTATFEGANIEPRVACQED